MKNITLVEDHLLVREGIERLVTLKDSYAVIGSFDNAEALLASADLSSIDLLVTDIQLGDTVGY